MEKSATPAPKKGSLLEKRNAWALCLGLSFILCTALLTRSIFAVRSGNSTVSVTGQGSRQMRSDWVVWTGTITAFDSSSKEACAKSLARQRQLVTDYLKANGIVDSTFEFSSINVSEEEESNYNSKGDYIGTRFKGYEMRQNVTVRTEDIDNVKFISRDITSLLSDGVDIASQAPSYYIRNLGDLKLSLIDVATENAKTRAKKLINGFAKLKDIADIDVGVFQITGLYSDDDYSYGGSYNTSSEWKQVSVTVHARYIVK